MTVSRTVLMPLPACVRPRMLLAMLPVWVGMALGITLLLVTTPAHAQRGDTSASDAEAIRRGERVFQASGGCGCHTDRPGGGPELAGGRALKTPFGTFYSTNITPDPETGLGRWSEADFIQAMRQGVGPAGERYFPVFPYTSFTRMRDADLSDLWAYLRSRPPVHRANRAHDVWPPFGWRLSARAWQALFFTPARFQPDPERDAEWNRGAYLVAGPAHCAECHTPRNALTGTLQDDAYLAGSVDGPEGELAPNITTDEETGVGRWSLADMTWFLETGFKPQGDDAQGLMAEAIEHGYALLPAEDRRAMAVYLRTVPPIENTVKKP